MEKKLGYQLETDDSEDDSVNNRPLTANIKKVILVVSTVLLVTCC